MSRWITYEPDFYDEIVPLFDELIEDDEEECLLTCKCYGRGKMLNEVEVPRIPQLHFEIEKQKYVEKTRFNEDPKSRRAGRGRARVRKNMISDEISSVGQSQVTVLPHFEALEKHRVFSNHEPKKNTGGFGRPSYLLETNNDNFEFINLPSTRRGFSIEDFILRSSYSQKKKKSKTSTGSTPQLSSTEDTDRCTSPENNEAVHAPPESSGAGHTIDGYLLSKMLNIPCTAGEKVINTDGSTASSLTAYSISPTELLDRFEDAFPQRKREKKEKKGPGGAKSSSVLNTVTVDGWVLHGDNVIEISDLPGDCDVSLLRDIIAAYGSILESDLISSGSTISVRYQLDSSEAADWVVSNLHNADHLYTDHRVTCKRV